MINTLNFKGMDREKFGEELLDAAMGLSVKLAKDYDMKALSYSDIEDCAMETVNKALKSLDSFDESKGKFITWLGTIAFNTLVSELRKETRRNCLFVSNAVSKKVKDEDGKDVVAWFDAYDAVSKESADDYAICNETRRKAFKVIDNRSERDATIIKMSICGYGPKETAEILDLTPSVVSMSINHTRKALKAEIPVPVTRKRKEFKKAV